MQHNFIYEPYFISLIISLILTFIYFFIQKNRKISLEENEQTNISFEIKSILFFIIS